MIFKYKQRWELEMIKTNAKDSHENKIDKSQKSDNVVLENEFHKKINYQYPRNSKIINNEIHRNSKEVLNLKRGEKVWYLEKSENKIVRVDAQVVKRISRHVYLIKVRFRDRTAHVNQLQKRYFRIENRPVIEVQQEENEKEVESDNKDINSRKRPRESPDKETLIRRKSKRKKKIPNRLMYH
jgi:hypothetical protein